MGQRDGQTGNHLAMQLCCLGCLSNEKPEDCLFGPKSNRMGPSNKIAWVLNGLCVCVEVCVCVLYFVYRHLRLKENMLPCLVAASCLKFTLSLSGKY